MSAQETESMLLVGRQSLLDYYRFAAEMSLTKAKLLQAPDLTVLQAFIIYLVSQPTFRYSLGFPFCQYCSDPQRVDEVHQLALHACREYATSWNLLPVAVRIASSLGLPNNCTTARSPIDREVRRRVWYCVAVLDAKISMDRGFAPFIPVQDLGHPPLILNDAALSQTGTAGQIPPALTAMAFCDVTYQATIYAKQLCDPPVGSSDGSKGWSTKLLLISEFDRSMKDYCSMLETSSAPYARFVTFTASDIALNMQLLARRPPYRS